VVEPKIFYEPSLVGEDDNIFYQAGAFPTRAEAQKVLDIWKAEGRQEEMVLNMVSVYETAEEWQADR
jgi:hypothetical protein